MDAATTEKNSPADEFGSARSSPRPRLPPLKSLLAFEAAARHANFTQAGAELGVTPSAVSHQIQSLEDFLGVRLFLRQSRQVALTAEGKLYRHEIEAALSDRGCDPTHRSAIAAQYAADLGEPELRGEVAAAAPQGVYGSRARDPGARVHAR